MRILQLINGLGVGGAEKLVTDLAPLINQMQGYECDVMVLGKVGESIFENMLRDRGVTILYLEYEHIYSIQIIHRLAELFKKYEIVHVHLFPSQLWAVLAKVLYRRKAKLITTEHSTNNRRRGKTVLRYLDKFIYQRYDMVIFISEDAQKSLCKWLRTSCELEKYKVILNGVDIARIDSATTINRNEIGIPKDAMLIMCVGRLEKVKNHVVQIEALSKLSDCYHLAIVGDGALRCSLERYAEELGVQHRTHFLGVRSDVPSLIKAADIIILTSHWEGLSLACIEGMSCCPFIGTNVNGIRDVVWNAGLLIPDSDSDALVENIRQLSSDRYFYNKIKIECRRRAEQFDINEMVVQYMEVFNKM